MKNWIKSLVLNLVLFVPIFGFSQSNATTTEITFKEYCNTHAISYMEVAKAKEQEKQEAIEQVQTYVNSKLTIS